MRIVYEVIERTTNRDGQFFIVPDIECNTIWTNLGWSDDDIIRGYHAHGECEQYHSEIKTDTEKTSWKNTKKQSGKRRGKSSRKLKSEGYETVLEELSKRNTHCKIK